MVLELIRTQYASFTKGEKRVADAIAKDPNMIIDLGISELAALTNSSDATIIRFCRRLGLTGFYQLKINLANELGNQGFLVGSKSLSADLFSDYWFVLESYIKRLIEELDKEKIANCAEQIINASTIHISGWGNTGMAAADFAHRLTRFGFQTFTTNIPEYGMRNLATCKPGTLFIGISHSGLAIHVIDMLKLAKSLGLSTILISNDVNSPASRYADIEICSSIKRELFQDLGAESHIIEMMVIDLVMYVIKSKIETPSLSDQAEVLLSRHKL